MIVKAKSSNNTSRYLLKAGAVSASVIIPAVYMTKFHMDMFEKDDKQNRAIMRNKMIGFLAGTSLSAMLVHKMIRIGNVRIFDSKNNNVIQALKIGLAAAAPFVGLETAKKINKAIYPQKPDKS